MATNWKSSKAVTNPIGAGITGLVFIALSAVVFRLIETPPAISPEVWPAWAQAVMSALAVLVAIWLQDRRRRQVERERRQAWLHGLMLVTLEAVTVVNVCHDRSDQECWTEFKLTEAKAAVAAALEDVRALSISDSPFTGAAKIRAQVRTVLIGTAAGLDHIEDLFARKAKVPKGLFASLREAAERDWARILTVVPIEDDALLDPD